VRRNPYEDDHNEEVLYRYGVDAVLPFLTPDGSWVAPDVAPLPARRIEVQLRRIAQHPAHRRQSVTFFSEDAKVVVLHPDKTVHVLEDHEHEMRPPA
jgi:hypothetical protein